MSRYRLLHPAVAIAVLALSACSGAEQPGAPAIAPDHSHVRPNETVAASFMLRIDPTVLGASLVMTDRIGASQPPQNLSYDLDLDQFRRGDTLQLGAVRWTPENDLEIAYTHAHPFPHPDPAQPITANNRADLGYTGRLLVVTETPAVPYFGGTVQLDPDLMSNADGYFAPGDLVATSLVSDSTIFPYKLLADEALNNRIGLSNHDDPTGNYDTTTGGWQSSNLEAGWTGFDYVHGGQTVANTLRFRRAAMPAMPFEVRLVLFVKYTDPRGMGGRTLRLPPNPADVTQFAYRLPYAALDASVIATDPDSRTLVAAQNSATILKVEVRDWDAQAMESGGTDLSLESEVSLIPAGESGAPVVEWDAPLLAGVTRTFNPPSTGSGFPGDELHYEGLVVNALGTATAGSVYGLLRVTDPSVALDVSARHFGVDPETLAADASRRRPPVVYQSVEINLRSTLPQPPSQSYDLPDAKDRPAGVGLHQGRPLLLAGEAHGDVTKLRLYQADSPAPTGPSHWSWHESTLLDQGNTNHNRPGIGVLEDRIVLAYATRQSHPRSQIKVAVALTPNPTQPSDWLEYTLFEIELFPGLPSGLSGSCQMTEVAGRLVIVWQGEMFGGMGIALSPTTIPVSPLDWNQYAFVDCDKTLGLALTSHDDRAAVMYHEWQSGELRLAQARFTYPFDASEWDHSVIMPTPYGRPRALTSIQGRLAGFVDIRDGDLSEVPTYGEFFLSQRTDPMQPADWIHYPLNPLTAIAGEGAATDLAVWDGRLIATYPVNEPHTTLHAARALTALPHSPGDWQQGVINDTGAAHSSLLPMGNRLLIAGVGSDPLAGTRLLIITLDAPW